MLEKIFAAKTQLQAIEAEATSILRRRGRVELKLPGVRVEVEEAEAARLKVLTADREDAKAEAGAQRRLETARSALEGLEAALREFDRQLGDVEVRRVAEADRLERHASAERIRHETEAAEEALTQLMPALRKFADAWGELGPIHFDSQQISGYANNAAQTLEVAATVAIDELQRIALAIESGGYRAPNRTKPAQVMAKPPMPPMRQVFATQPLAWTDADGNVKTHPAWFEVTLTTALAERAIELGAAVNLDHETAKANRLAPREFLVPVVDRCIALNDVGAQPHAVELDKPKWNGNGTTLPPGFEPLDRGPGFNVTTEGAVR